MPCPLLINHASHACKLIVHASQYCSADKTILFAKKGAATQNATYKEVTFMHHVAYQGMWSYMREGGGLNEPNELPLDPPLLPYSVIPTPDNG